jgi:hypothetical protein
MFLLLSDFRDRKTRCCAFHFATKIYHFTTDLAKFVSNNKLSLDIDLLLVRHKQLAIPARNVHSLWIRINNSRGTAP